MGSRIPVVVQVQPAVAALESDAQAFRGAVVVDHRGAEGGLDPLPRVQRQALAAGPQRQRRQRQQPGPLPARQFDQQAGVAGDEGRPPGRQLLAQPLGRPGHRHRPGAVAQPGMLATLTAPEGDAGVGPVQRSDQRAARAQAEGTERADRGLQPPAVDRAALVHARLQQARVDVQRRDVVKVQRRLAAGARAAPDGVAPVQLAALLLRVGREGAHPLQRDRRVGVPVVKVRHHEALVHRRQIAPGRAGTGEAGQVAAVERRQPLRVAQQFVGAALRHRGGEVVAQAEAARSFRSLRHGRRAQAGQRRTQRLGPGAHPAAHPPPGAVHGRAAGVAGAARTIRPLRGVVAMVLRHGVSLSCVPRP